MERKERKLRLWFFLLAVNLVIIWGNSLLPGEISAAISGGLKTFLMKLLPARQGGGSGGSGLLRKMAHFAEFTCLGICLSQIFRILKTKTSQWLLLPLIWGVVVACVDETIQCFVPDRGPRLFDVGLDSCGVVTGIFIISLMHYFKKKRKNLEEKQV